MRLREDQRGVAIQVGVALLLAIFTVALTLYQVNVVPQQNQATEYQHSQTVNEKLQEVRNAVVSVPGGGSGGSVTVPLGTSYRSRTFTLNPPDPVGTLTTTPAARISIDNAVATGGEEVRQFWNGTEQSVWTRGLAYRPDYNEYRSAPTTVYENTVLYDRHDSATVPRTDQVLIEGNTITLVALNGTYSLSAQRSVSVDLRAASTSSRSIAVSNETGSNVTITIPSRIPVEKWRSELLGDESAVTAVTDTGQDAGAANLIEITLRQGTYRLRMAKVGIGSGVTTEESAYVTDVRGDGSSVQAGGRQTLTVEVRDQYNNPVAGRSLEANVTAGGGTIAGSNTSTTGADGRASFTYNASASPGTAQIAVNLTGPNPPQDYEQVTFSVYVDPGGNDGGNQAPNADAGTDRTVAEGDRVTLDGTGSSDPDGDSLSYDWTQTAGPSVTLQDSTTPTPEFDAPSVNSDQTLTFELTVTDGEGLSDTDSVSVVVENTDNQPPNADAGSNQTVPGGDRVTLDASGSSDPNGDTLSYSWQQTAGPSVSLEDPNTVTPEFDAPSVSSDRTLQFEVTVTDGEGGSDTDSVAVTVTASNSPPDATFTASCSGLTCDFDASSSSDPDGDSLSYSWTFGDGTTGSGETTTHTYDRTGTYDVTLTVDDGSASDQVTKSVTVEGPVISAFQPDPQSMSDGNGEFVRVYFPTPTDVTGWTITDSDGESTALPSGTLDGEVYFARDADEFASQRGIDPARVYNFDNSLNQGGDTVVLRDGSGAAVDRAGYNGVDTANGWSISVGEGEVAVRRAGSGTKYRDNNTENDWRVESEDAFFPDSAKPSIQSASLPDREIDNAEAGNNLRQNLSVTFDEDMDQSVAPSIAFENLVASGNLTVVEQSWTGARTYEWELKFLQNGADDEVRVNVTDARDLAGNRMNEETALNFTFDANPPGDPNAIRLLTDPINRSTVGDVDVRVTNPSTIEGDETVEVQFTGPNDGTFVVSEPISSGTYTYVNGSTVSTLTDGNYVVAGARLVDDVGNTNPSDGYSAVQSNQVTKDTIAPSVEQFDLSTINGDDLRVSLDASEKLKGGNYDYERIEVRVTSQDGTFSTVLDETDFNEINSDWVYNATITGVADGNYTAEVTVIRDIVGNDGTTGQTDRTSVGPATDFVTKSGQQVPTGGVNVTLRNQGYSDVTIENVTVSTGGKVKGIYENDGGNGPGNREVYVDAATDDGYVEAGDGQSNPGILGQTVGLDDQATIDARTSATLAIRFFRDNNGRVNSPNQRVQVEVCYSDGSCEVYTVTV